LWYPRVSEVVLDFRMGEDEPSLLGVGLVEEGEGGDDISNGGDDGISNLAEPGATES